MPQNKKTKIKINKSNNKIFICLRRGRIDFFLLITEINHKPRIFFVRSPQGSYFITSQNEKKKSLNLTVMTNIWVTFIGPNQVVGQTSSHWRCRYGHTIANFWENTVSIIGKRKHTSLQKCKKKKQGWGVIATKIDLRIWWILQKRHLVWVFASVFVSVSLKERSNPLWWHHASLLLCHKQSRTIQILLFFVCFSNHN